MRRTGTSSSGQSLVASSRSNGKLEFVLLLEDLDAELVLRIVALLDRFPQVAAVIVRILARELLRFVPHQRVDAEQRFPVKLHEARLALRIHEAEGVDAEAVHHSEAARDGAIGERPHDYVHAFRDERDEVPEGVVGGGCLGHFVVRFRFARVDDVRELDGVLDEEHRDVVADQVEDAFVGVELRREAAHIANGVGGATRAQDRREADEDRRLLRGVLQE